MKDLIRKKCEEYDITPDVLTRQELDELQEEIRKEQQGEIMCDSVLDDPEIHLRAIENSLKEKVNPAQ